MASRKGDISILVRQDNDESRIIIESVDAAIENIIGYEAEELIGTDLVDILLPTTADTLRNFLEYDAESENDLGAVLSRVRDFGFITKLGYEVKISMRVSRAMSDEKKQKFDIVIRDHSEISEGSKSALRNFKGRQIIDKVTGLPDYDSFMRESEFINFCINKDRLVASFALIAVDGLDNFSDMYGMDSTVILVRELVSCCRVNFREDDIIGAIGGGRIGVVLLDATAPSAKIPLNRLRWQIASHPFDSILGNNVNVTLSVVFCQLSKDRIVEDAIRICEEGLKEASKSGGNKLIELD